MSSQGGLSTLKDLLFEEEKQKYVELNEKLKEVNVRIDDSLNNRTVPDDEIDQIVGKMVQVMPEKLGPTITETLKVQIRDSKDDVVQALFPIIGQMIKKYVAQEISVLSEKIDRQIENLFSLENLALRVKAIFSGQSYGELIIQKASEGQIQEIFIIEEHSGILMASYSRNKTMDQDMIAGMLTAIKSFVKDSFDEKNQELETISYDAFSVYVQNFNKFYVAVAISGVITAEFKAKLDNTILQFIRDISAKLTDLDEKKLAQKIEHHFKKI
ncbi:MAG: hypothetical protein ABJG78_12120 [Cyclobacteriaceae bacterium]